jgi:lysophospholipase L1-like esterase
MKMRLSKTLYSWIGPAAIGILAAAFFYATFNYVNAQLVDRPLNVIAFGDSITAGVGTTGERNFVTLLSERTGIAIDNQGVSGNTTAQALARLDASVLSKDPDIVIVFLGGNDILQNVDEEVTFANVRSIVTQIQNSGAKVVLTSIHDGFILNDYEDAYQDIANDTGAYFVSGILRGVIGRSDLMFDAVHPNNAGHVIIADRIFPTLVNAIEASDDGLTLHASCYADPAFIETNQSVTWNVFTYGGTGIKTYTWAGADSLSSNQASFEQTYTQPGIKTASVTVNSGSDSKTVSCINQVNVVTPSVFGSCSVEVLSQGDPESPERIVRWTAHATGGTGEYAYSWIGNEISSRTEQSIDITYASAGLKTATVTISSGGKSENLTCSALISPHVGTSTPLSGRCSMDNSNPIINEDIVWRADAYSGEGEIGFAWFGDATGTSTTSTVRYSQSGKKEAGVIINSQQNILELRCQAIIASTTPRNTATGCFIATAAYGTDMEADVVALRDFRDEELMTNTAGKMFVQTYYKVSPPIADFIRDHDTLRAGVRGVLKPVVALVK